MTNEPVRACFVLSAGRTGTVALAKRLGELLPNATVLHEPAPARLELLIGNLRNDTGFGRGPLRSLFLWTRRRRIGRLPPGSAYVEINPLLCPLVDLLTELDIPFNVIHMVRQPDSWAQSITAFGASARFRAIVDYVPFAKPYPQPRPDGWGGMAEVERALWRWRICNERILSLRPHCGNYLLVRYEDLFSNRADVRAGVFRRIVQLMPGAPIDISPTFDAAERHNPAPRAAVAAPRSETVRTVCGDLAGRLGYEIG